MTIDTSEKRLSILDFDPTTSIGIPIPRGTIGNAEKLHLLWLYSGLFDEDGADFQWPFDDLKPRDIGIYPVGAPIGGGVSLTGKEPTIDSGAGFWRIVLGGIPVKTRDAICAWRALESGLEGRGKTIAIPIYDGKRAPWPDTPGGSIDSETVGAVPRGSTTLHITLENIGEVYAGMHFSIRDRLYRVKTVQGDSATFDIEIWPKLREAVESGQALEFRRPLCRVRLARDDGMALRLDGHKRGEATLEFVEAL